MALLEAWIQVFNYVKHTNAIYCKYTNAKYDDKKNDYYIDCLFIGSNFIFRTGKKADHYGRAQ